MKTFMTSTIQYYNILWYSVTCLSGPTMKVKRSVVMEKYSDEIEELYAQSINLPVM